MTGRIHLYEPAQLDSEQRALYDAITAGPRSQPPQPFPLTDELGRLHGPFNALLVSPHIGMATQALGAAIRYGSRLSDRAREVAILELAAVRRCNFEWYAHERVGRMAGLSDAEIAALRSGAAADSLSSDEVLVRDIVRMLVTERDLNAALYAAAVTSLGVRALMDIIALVGYFDLLALSLRVWQAPLPAGVEPAFE